MNEQSDAVLAATRAIGAEGDDHPTYEMLAGVVDGSADDVTREIVDTHAAVCASCAAELDDLRAFASPQRAAWWPLTTVAAAAAVIVIATFVIRDRSGEHRPIPPVRRAVIHRSVAPPAPTYARPQWSRLVADALRTGRVEMPDDLRAFTRSDVFRGSTSGADAVRLSPTASSVLVTKPRFTWSGTNADDYQVRVYANDRPVVQSKRLRETSWTCTRTLDRGKTYRWQIVARHDGKTVFLPQPPAPPAVFRVIDSAQLEELQSAAHAHPADDLLLGLLHARAGVIDTARMHLARYATATQSPIAAKLLASIERQ